MRGPGSLVVGSGLVLVVLLGSAPAAGSAQQAPRLTIRGAIVTAQWREGWFKGSVKFRGTVGAPARLTAIVRRVAGRALPRRLDFSVGRAGRFRRTIPLSPRPLPGVYRLRLFGSTSSGELPTVQRRIRVPAPTEGIVDRAAISVKPGGPRVRVLRGRQDVLFARFHFLVLPRADEVQVEWRTPSYQVFVSSTKPSTTTVRTRVRSLETPLQQGTWYCILTAGGKIAKRVTVRIR
jgi:hypothetical protein